MEATTTVASKIGVTTGRTPAHGFQVIYNKCLRLAEEHKEHVKKKIKDTEF